MNDSNAKQQIVDKIKNNTNILVTVSADPSVDELSAALGLTVLLNKLGKHATAVFSGQVPPAITFLDPEKTFENTVDSLRDFIIALDKEKADHLRYKVEGDVVKIFITPYRTTISSDDLKFSQGDYNVEVVLALGVSDRDNLDQALAAHGRILHDAVVASVGTGEPSNLGSVDWTEANASCLSEMMVSLADALKGDKQLLDEQISTAFLTGIVAATDRFSNDRTSSRVMTMAAQLMGAGANQQLIAAKLEEAHEIGSQSNDEASQTENSDGSTDLTEGESSKVDKSPSKKPKKAKKEQPPKKKDDGALVISHEKEGTVDEVGEQTEEERQAAAAEAAAAELEKQTKATTETQQSVAAKEAETKLAEQLAQVAPAAAAPEAAAKPSVADLQKDLAEASSEVDKAASLPPVVEQPPQSLTPPQIPDGEPSIGGTLNATTEQAAEDKRRTEANDRNHTILSHNAGEYVGPETKPTYEAPLNAAMSSQKDEPSSVDVFGDAPSAGLPSDTAKTQKTDTVTPPSSETPTMEFEPTPLPPSQPQTPAPTLDQIDQQNRTPHDDARAAIDAAFAAAPFEPANNPQQNIGAQSLGEVPHAEPAPAPASTTPLPPPPPAAPVAPPMPDFSTLPPVPDYNAPGATPQPPAAPLPPENLEAMLGQPQPTQANDPGQFQIPGAK